MNNEEIKHRTKHAGRRERNATDCSTAAPIQSVLTFTCCYHCLLSTSFCFCGALRAPNLVAMDSVTCLAAGPQHKRKGSVLDELVGNQDPPSGKVARPGVVEVQQLEAGAVEDQEAKVRAAAQSVSP